jgi:DNA invertase Pin-like site-specific DNA recombinase
MMVKCLNTSFSIFQVPTKSFSTTNASPAVLRATEQPIDTGKAAGKCFLDMLGVFAEFETNLRRERQLEGIAKAKAAGVYKGRPPSIEASREKRRGCAN